MTNELIREESNPLNQAIVDRAGLVEIATTVIAPLEITSDTTLTADRRGPIVIAADNVTLDCAHHSLIGSANGIGIQASGRTGVTIARCVVNGFGEGIVLEDSFDSVLSENTLSENVNAGIRLVGSDRNRLTGNLVSYTRSSARLATGLSLESSSDNKLEFNAVDHSDGAGVTASDGSHSNELVANVSSFNGGPGFEVAGASNSLLRNTATRNGDFGFVLREEASRNKLIDNAGCLNQPADATELRAGRRRNGNVWALNLFCSPAF
jgi:parallel beta-helix repeat protein